MDAVTPPSRIRRRTRDALRGVKLGVRGRSSFFAYFFWALAAVLIGSLFGLAAWEWAALVTAFGFVTVTELMFVAVSSVVMELPVAPAAARRVHRIAAGATLAAIMTGLALIAILVGGRIAG